MGGLTIALAQATDGGVFTDVLLLTIVFIFASAIIGAVVARRKRDRCLVLVHDYHLTMTLADGQAIQGDLRVFAQGIELEYDEPSRSQQGGFKSSYLLYQPEMERVVAFCRYAGDLTEDERRTRLRQVEARFRPGLMRRVRRSILNVFNTIRDAFRQAMNAFIGQLGKVGGKTSVPASHQSELEGVGKTLMGAIGNAYEPMLERHIGRPVVLDMLGPADPNRAAVELCGYLAEYSDQYLAVFNVEQPVEETIALPADQSSEREDLRIDVDSASVRVTNTSSVPLVVDAVVSDGGETREHGAVLTRGSAARLPRIPGSLSVRLHRVRRIDVVCHRKHAVIRYAGVDEPTSDSP